MSEGMTTDEIWAFVGLWAFFSALVALYAKDRGHRPWTWFAVSFVLSPLLALIALMLQPNRKDTPAPPRASATPPCPRCGTARITGQRHCPGCGLDLWADYDAKRA